jgi:ABC-type uncharacterized transport system permease subunit
MSTGTAIGGRTRRGRWRDLLFSWFALPIAALAALLIGAVMLFALGANPLTAYRSLLDGAFGSVDGLIQTTIKAVPILLVGVGICIAFRANVLNIGGEGQIVMGGLAATAVALALPNLPGPVLITLVLLAGAVGGGVWGSIAGALKAYFNVNEILSTIMLNIVAVQIMNYLLSGPLVDRSFSGFSLIPQTKRLPVQSDLPILIHGTQLHSGALFAVLAAVGAYVLLWRTGLGFRLRAVGLSREASSYAGMPVKRTIVLALTLAGAMAGLAGAILVFGSASHRMVTDGTATGFTGSAGFNGIVAALFGALNPLWTIVSSFIFGGLLVGGNFMQITVQVPTALIVALDGLLVVFVVAIDYPRRQARMRLRIAEEPAQPERTPEAPEPVGPGPAPGTPEGVPG